MNSFIAKLVGGKRRQKTTEINKIASELDVPRDTAKEVLEGQK